MLMRQRGIPKGLVANYVKLEQQGYLKGDNIMMALLCSVL